MRADAGLHRRGRSTALPGFHENRRYARTASYAQVTEKLYDRSRFRYRHYRAASGAGDPDPAAGDRAAGLQRCDEPRCYPAALRRLDLQYAGGARSNRGTSGITAASTRLLLRGRRPKAEKNSQPAPLTIHAPSDMNQCGPVHRGHPQSPAPAALPNGRSTSAPSAMPHREVRADESDSSARPRSTSNLA